MILRDSQAPSQVCSGSSITAKITIPSKTKQDKALNRTTHLGRCRCERDLLEAVLSLQILQNGSFAGRRGSYYRYEHGVEGFR